MDVVVDLRRRKALQELLKPKGRVVLVVGEVLHPVSTKVSASDSERQRERGGGRERGGEREVMGDGDGLTSMVTSLLMKSSGMPATAPLLSLMRWARSSAKGSSLSSLSSREAAPPGDAASRVLFLCGVPFFLRSGDGVAVAGSPPIRPLVVAVAPSKRPKRFFLFPGLVSGVRNPWA